MNFLVPCGTALARRRRRAAALGRSKAGRLRHCCNFRENTRAHCSSPGQREAAPSLLQWTAGGLVSTGSKLSHLPARQVFQVTTVALRHTKKSQHCSCVSPYEAKVKNSTVPATCTSAGARVLTRSSCQLASNNIPYQATQTYEHFKGKTEDARQ